MSAIDSWHEERQSAWLYRQLAQTETSNAVAKLFTDLAAAAEQQALHWEGLMAADGRAPPPFRPGRSEEHTSELQSLMRISYAVFCLKKKNNTKSKLEQRPQKQQHNNTYANVSTQEQQHDNTQIP